ncbi:hypothetical protein LAUMK13_02511 [Mycobacterium innocens]|uniref:Uncharacterized protein n=1 Tax=Mycobacterium innocens TaxID=2341083 RepID=A0A498Q090_9MYCO|nr:hypothetical protein LAUMK13_02511 [Mycobacterium innocens]
MAGSIGAGLLSDFAALPPEINSGYVQRPRIGAPDGRRGGVGPPCG